MGPYGPREPWALRAHGPWALRAQGRALWARWALRAQLSPCRYAEDDFFAPYMRSKVCPILVAPRGKFQIHGEPMDCGKPATPTAERDGGAQRGVTPDVTPLNY